MTKVLFLENYKRKKKEDFLRDIYNTYLDDLYDISEGLQETEDFLLEIENNYGSKILKKVFKKLTKREKGEIEEILNTLRLRIDCIERRVSISPFYKKEKPP